MAETPQAAEASTQATPKETKLVYEVGFHLVPTLSEGEAPSAVEKIRALVGKAGGAVFAEEAPKRLKLAYRVERSESGAREKYTESWFGWMKFDGEEELKGGIPGLQEALRGMKDVFRFLVVETVRETPAPLRALYSSDRLEGETIAAPKRVAEKSGPVSEAELEKGIESLIS